jgi:peptidoglycan/xylan/chitin deacetylase (PgdA/CDA1 family)
MLSRPSRLRRWMRRSLAQPVVLMYHRIAHPAVDPWGLAVRAERFEHHLSVLRRHRRTLPMSELVGRLQDGTLPRNAAAVTFDDGYADNFLEARPRLAAAGVPATLFLTTGALEERTEFWWDELARAILLREAALDCEIEIAGERCLVRFGADGRLEHERRWRAWQAPETAREAAYLDVWTRLRAAPACERSAAMCRVRGLLRLAPPEPNDLPMTRSQVRELAADRLFEFGGHTVTHPVLTALDAAQRLHEITQGRIACEEILGRPIEGFAYPHGAHDAGLRTIVRQCGFAWACSTESRAVARRDYDLFALPRVQACDWDATDFERTLLST